MAAESWRKKAEAPVSPAAAPLPCDLAGQHVHGGRLGNTARHQRFHLHTYPANPFPMNYLTVRAPLWFATATILKLANDVKWLDKATRIVREHTRAKNQKTKAKNERE
jgi:hypothetical protein